MTKPDSKPIIPVEEFRRRWHKVQAMMGEQELDFLVAYADDQAGLYCAGQAKERYGHFS